MRLLLPAILLLLCPAFSQASKHRAVWFWQDAGSPYGASNIVGNNVLENQTVAILQNRMVKRVYGSYGQHPVTNAAVIAGWNAKLEAAGIQSQFLMSENTWIFPSNHAGFLMKISERVIDFNNAPGRTAAQKFDGLHLDIEPQALGEWSGLSAAGKRNYLLLLRDTYAAVRQHLTNEGAPAFPVYADLPVWFDNLPVDGGSIGWSGAAERDQWFADIAVSLTGISLMAFERTTLSSISNGVAWERANISGADVRVGLEADVGAGLTWATLADFNVMIENVEGAFGPGDAVEIQSYTLWREAIAAGPIVSVAVAFHYALALGSGDISFDTETNWTYLVHHTIDLCAWQEIQRVKAAETGSVKLPVRLREPRGFWRVTRFRTPEP